MLWMPMPRALGIRLGRCPRENSPHSCRPFRFPPHYGTGHLLSKVMGQYISVIPVLRLKQGDWNQG